MKPASYIRATYYARLYQLSEPVKKPHGAGETHYVVVEAYHVDAKSSRTMVYAADSEGNITHFDPLQVLEVWHHAKALAKLGFKEEGTR
jgi:hypothetical protein